MPENSAARRFDRHLRLAEKMTGEPREAVLNKFVGQRVLVTGDPRRLATRSGHRMLLTAVNLIARFCPRIDLGLPAELADLASEALQLIRAIDRSVYADFRALEVADQSGYCAVLSI